MSEDDDAHLGCARGVPTNSAGVKGGVPLREAQSVRCVSPSDRRFTIKGVFCEVARTESHLEGTMKEDGVAIHSLSGGVDLQFQESFDQLKVAVKRGEIDWLHILPPATWISTHCVLTRCAKLCRMATRRHTLWSMEGSGSSELWESNTIKSLYEIEGAHFIHDAGFGFLTNVPFWNSTSDFAQLSGRFQKFLNRTECNQKSGEITITMDEVAGGGAQKSYRAVREEEK